MQYTFKDLEEKGLKKSFVYETLKHSLPFSKQFKDNKRIFNENDLKMFKDVKQFGIKQTVWKIWNIEDIGKDTVILKASPKSSDSLDNNFPNSLDDVWKMIEKAVDKRLQTVQREFENREDELKNEIIQKDQIIQIKEDQTQKYALLKQEEKKEKEEWIKRHDEVKKNLTEKNDTLLQEKNEWVGKFYSVKMYMIIFLILFVLMVAFEVVQYLK